MKHLRLLAFLLLFTLFCSCQTQPTSTLDTTADTSASARLTVCQNGKSDFRIVLPENSSKEAENAAKELYLKFQSAFGLILPIVNDTASETPTEILIGNTSRTPDTALANDEILIQVKNDKIILVAGNDAALSEAVSLLWEQLTVDGNNATLPADLCLQKQSTQKDTETKSMTLKIATYNIANGRDVNYDYSVLAQDILTSGASIVGLQEVDQRTNRNGNRDTMAQLSRFTGWEYYYFVPTISPYQGGEYGIGLLSKYPILDTSFQYLPKSDENEEQRAVLCATVNVDGVELHCFVTHSQQVSITQQLTAISQLAVKKAPYAVLGDFNYQNFSLFHSVFLNATLANDDGNRLETTKNGQAFDNMIFSKNITMNGVSLIQTNHSDHHLLVAEITVSK